MKKLLKLSSLLLSIVLLFSFAAMTSCGSTQSVEQIIKDGKIVMLTNAAFPPFEYVEGGNVVGVDADIASEIAKDLGVSLEIQNMEFESIVGAVKSGKGSFGAAGMSITDERKKNVDFSIEYITSSQYIIVLADNTTITTGSDLSGKKVGVQTGTTGDIYVTDEDGENGIKALEVKRYKNAIDASMDLKNGKIDAVVIDTLPSQEIVAKNAELKRIDNILTNEKFAICVKKGNTTLVEAIDATLNRLISEGKIDEFVLKHTT